MIRVRYISAAWDSSGYASAARQYMSTLMDNKGIDLTAKVVSFEHQKTSHGDLQEKIQGIVNRQIDPEIQIIHLTPENFPLHRDPKLYNIAYTVWETSKLPSKWVDHCNSMDELWVPSDWNIQVFKESGVIKPIYKIPHIIPINNGATESLQMDISQETFIFYSIFQWIERKNPMGLLKAYLTEFKSTEPVVLALKTYRLNTSPAEQNVIKDEIIRLKHFLRLESYPPLLFFGSLLSVEQMRGLHSCGNCFVLPHKGEGFGIPIAGAMTYGKPVISTRYGGNLEYMTDENSYLIDYSLTPVCGMIFPNYSGDMIWAEPDIMHLRRLMRHVFTNKREAQEKGLLGMGTIKKGYNPEIIGNLMFDRLSKIHATRSGYGH